MLLIKLRLIDAQLLHELQRPFEVEVPEGVALHADGDSGRPGVGKGNRACDKTCAGGKERTSIHGGNQSGGSLVDDKTVANFRGDATGLWKIVFERLFLGRELHLSIKLIKWDCQGHTRQLEDISQVRVFGQQPAIIRLTMVLLNADMVLGDQDVFTK